MAYPESAHPYTNDLDDTQVYTATDSATVFLLVTFDALTEAEQTFDFIHVLDENDAEINESPFTGTELANRTLAVYGQTVKVRLVTDESEVKWGYSVTNIQECVRQESSFAAIDEDEGAFAGSYAYYGFGADAANVFLHNGYLWAFCATPLGGTAIKVYKSVDGAVWEQLPESIADTMGDPPQIVHDGNTVHLLYTTTSHPGYPSIGWPECVAYRQFNLTTETFTTPTYAPAGLTQGCLIKRASDFIIIAMTNSTAFQANWYIHYCTLSFDGVFGAVEDFVPEGLLGVDNWAIYTFGTCKTANDKVFVSYAWNLTSGSNRTVRCKSIDSSNVLGEDLTVVADADCHGTVWDSLVFHSHPEFIDGALVVPVRGYKLADGGATGGSQFAYYVADDPDVPTGFVKGTTFLDTIGPDAYVQPPSGITFYGDPTRPFTFMSDETSGATIWGTLPTFSGSNVEPNVNWLNLQTYAAGVWSDPVAVWSSVEYQALYPLPGGINATARYASGLGTNYLQPRVSPFNDGWLVQVKLSTATGTGTNWATWIVSAGDTATPPEEPEEPTPTVILGSNDSTLVIDLSATRGGFY